MSSIFEKDSFTLKELCNIFLLKNNDNVNNICNCYINFSSDNKKFREYLQNTRQNRCFIELSNDKHIYFRELLQIFDHEFNKLVIRISTNPKNYDISIKWNDFENKIKNITKNDIKSFIEE
jgi:hypothetical protein